jgi:hypothetical protein
MTRVDEFLAWTDKYLHALGYDTEYSIDDEYVYVELFNDGTEAKFSMGRDFLPPPDEMQEFVASRLYLVMIGVIRQRMEQVDEDINLEAEVNSILADVEDLSDADDY